MLALAEERGMPIINSHQGARALLGIERNISDALAARIAKLGGTVGVTIFDHMVGAGARRRRSGTATCPAAATTSSPTGSTWAPWRSYGSLTLGSDFNGLIARAAGFRRLGCPPTAFATRAT